jgi:ubiquinone biosynthesis UbiH/UbiF/VisC/COQ6 family hydroxylase
MATHTNITKADVVIVGAGLVGLTAAIAMATQGKQVVIVDSHATLPNSSSLGQWDARIYALTEETIAWLQSLGIWQYVDSARVQAISAMALWEPEQRAPLILQAEDAYLTQMGSILESTNLMQACLQAMKELDLEVTIASPTDIIQHQDRVELVMGDQHTFQAKLLIAADGVQSWVRQRLGIGVAFKSFHQTALVANFSAERAHQGVARQWFKAHETMALLPLPEQMVSMVWAVSTERAQQLLLDKERLVAEAIAFAEPTLGQLSLCGDVFPFPLSQQTAETYIAERLVLIGDAAHQVHPMAGQGVNLGFRDVMTLTNMTTKLTSLQDIGDYHFLRHYERARKLDVVSMNTLTSGVDMLFAIESPWMQRLAGWGMQKVNKWTWLKKRLVQTATL